MNSTKVVILAAGKGTRMNQDIPKALTPVAGKPILQHLVESIKGSNIKGLPVVVIGTDQPNLCEAFGEICDYAVQEDQLGTAHAAMCAEKAVAGADQMIVLYGDHPFVSKDSLNKLIETHETSGGVLSMMTVKLESFDGWHKVFAHWGRILRDDNSNVLGIREDKDASEDERTVTEVNPALFCFDREWFFTNITKVQNKNVQGEYYLTDMVELAVEQGYKIATVPIAPEESIGINTLEEKDIAEKILKART